MLPIIGESLAGCLIAEGLRPDRRLTSGLLLSLA